ncbi:MAG: mechanosensitive ion channel family protein [Elusimicrobia bacterium]|nr:mechanosensitive ion channel family protein [Elusimicrobiota bacterium]
MENELLTRMFLGNSVHEWLTAAGMFAAILAAVMVVKSVLLDRLKRWARRTTTHFDDVVVDALSGVRLREWAVLAAYFASRTLFFNSGVEKVLRLIVVLVVSLRAAVMLQAVLAYLWRRLTAPVQEGDPTARAALQNVEYVLNAAVWVGAGLFILDNVGVNITTAVAGLGIGGIAVAMAAQQILGDLFSSFVIFMDKPFKVGDFIIVDDYMGVVENVGIKTTRIQSLSGEALVFSNSDLTKSRIRNYKKMRERRVVASFGVLYETPLEKVKAFAGQVKDIFKTIPNTRLDRVHFKSFGDSSLDYEAVYYVLSPDYTVFMDIQQDFGFKLMDLMAREGLEMAYPTRTVYMANAGKKD